MSQLSPYWIFTPASLQFDFDNPQPEMIERRALAWSLSLEGRWAHNVQFPLSVAQHSLLVAGAIPQKQFRIYGLLHDAAKAFTRDLPTPFKHWLVHQGADVIALERRILAAVWKHFEVPPPSAEAAAAVDIADARADATEYRDVVRGRGPQWVPPAPPFPQVVRFMKQDKAEENFLRYLDLYLMDARAALRRGEVD